MKTFLIIFSLLTLASCSNENKPKLTEELVMTTLWYNQTSSVEVLLQARNLDQSLAQCIVPHKLSSILKKDFVILRVDGDKWRRVPAKIQNEWIMHELDYCTSQLKENKLKADVLLGSIFQD